MPTTPDPDRNDDRPPGAYTEFGASVYFRTKSTYEGSEGGRLPAARKVYPVGFNGIVERVKAHPWWSTIAAGVVAAVGWLRSCFPGD